MHPYLVRMIYRSRLVVVCIIAVSVPILNVAGGDPLSVEAEYSATLLKRVDSKTGQAQVFAKGDRFRLKYTCAIRTELGFSAIEIIRPDLAETWHVFPQPKQLLVLPTRDTSLSMRLELVGETSRTAFGNTTVGGSRRTFV